MEYENTYNSAMTIILIIINVNTIITIMRIIMFKSHTVARPRRKYTLHYVVTDINRTCTE